MHLNIMYKNIAMFFILIIITFFVVQKNIINSAPSKFYGDFQHDSETLVLGRVVADKYGKELPKAAHLGFASIIDFKYEPKYKYQSYSLVNSKEISDYTMNSEDINDSNWARGISKKFAGVVTKKDYSLSDYVGRLLYLPNGESRTIQAVEHVDNYTNIYLTGSVIDSTFFDFPVILKLSGLQVNPELILLNPYLSQYGIQGDFFSLIYNNVISKINALYYINSFVFSIVIASLVFLYRRIISTEFAVIFFLTIVLSPWIVSFARNLYWVPFSWFLPAVFSGFYFLSKSSEYKALSIVLVYFSFLFKCLAGYEYISSVILLAAAIFCYELFNPDRVISKSESLKGFFLICTIGVAGFVTALLMHANMRGDSIIEGLKSIYELDVKRRTYGDPSVFGSESFEALSSSPLTVVKTYIFNWNTLFLKGIPGYGFYTFLWISIATICYRWYESHQNTLKDLGLFIAFFISPLSWFILAKGHSGVHTHMNYVLWYFGFAACILSISLNGFKIAIIHITSWAKTANPEKI